MVARANVEAVKNGYIVNFYAGSQGKNKTYVAKDEKDLLEIFRKGLRKDEVDRK